MKKVLTMVLSVAMVLSMGVCAFAAEVSNDGGTQETTATYTEPQTFVVTIPSDITVAKKDGQATPVTVSAADVVIPANATLKVTVASTNEWLVKSPEGGDLHYGLYVDSKEDALATNGEVLSVVNGTATGSASLTAKLTEVATKSGTFTDTLTFTVNLV